MRLRRACDACARASTHSRASASCHHWPVVARRCSDVPPLQCKFPFLSLALHSPICSKLAIATAYLARENVEFIACNTDSTFPAIPGLKLPGAGRHVWGRTRVGCVGEALWLCECVLEILQLSSQCGTCNCDDDKFNCWRCSIVAAVATAAGRKPTVMTCDV